MNSRLLLLLNLTWFFSVNSNHIHFPWLHNKFPPNQKFLKQQKFTILIVYEIRSLDTDELGSMLRVSKG